MPSLCDGGPFYQPQLLTRSRRTSEKNRRADSHCLPKPFPFALEHAHLRISKPLGRTLHPVERRPRKSETELESQLNRTRATNLIERIETTVSPVARAAGPTQSLSERSLRLAELWV